MLCGQVRGACASANAGSDAVPSIRANMGAGSLLSAVGLEQKVLPDKMPWLKEHLSREQAAKLEPDDIRVQGTLARGLDAMRRFREVMGDTPPIFCMDTQGPFDLAHLLLGDDIFYALIDDPPFVEHVLTLCVEMGIRGHTWMKEISGEPRDRHHHGSLYAENMGIRICEDTTVLVNPETIREVVMPHTQRLAAHFGGAWVHYCGRNDHLTEAVLDLPEIRGVNFGHVPGHEHDHEFEADMERVARTGKVFFGGWPRRPGEGGRDYLRRMHRWAARGCLIPHGNAALGDPDGFPDVAAALDFWYGL
jgi:hypothetical protein